MKLFSYVKGVTAFYSVFKYMKTLYKAGFEKKSPDLQYLHVFILYEAKGWNEVLYYLRWWIWVNVVITDILLYKAKFSPIYIVAFNTVCSIQEIHIIDKTV